MTKVTASQPLQNMWYVACASKELRRGKTVHRQILDRPVLLGRDADGVAFAMADTCPHRGTLLSGGAFDGREVECPYHGWRFGTDGVCTHIPSLPAKDQKAVKVGEIRTPTVPVREQDGVIWVFAGTDPDGRPSPPTLPDVPLTHRLHLSMDFDCPIDLAVMGLMDPAHGAFVHSSGFWRTKKQTYEKTKSFSPTDLGWRMNRHKASSNSKAYQIFFGGRPATEITYQLPSVRIEHAELGHHHYCGLTVCTPVTAAKTRVHHMMAWSLPGGALLIPVAHVLGRIFLNQDRKAVAKMQAGQAFNPPLMWMRDADQQARWYLKLKKAWIAADEDPSQFKNPIQKQDLTWVS